jgi:spore germination protein KC
MNRRLLVVIPLLVVAIAANGCWDRRELESLGFVQALCLDLELPKRTIVVTAAIAIPSKLGAPQGGGDGGKESGMMVVTTKAPSVYEAFNLMNTSVNREITLQQNQLLIIGEDMAKYGVASWVDNLVRFREMRRTLLIFVSRGKAAEIFSVKPPLEKSPVEYISDLVSLTTRNGMFPKVMLNRFLERYSSFAQQNYAPLIAKTSLPKPQAKPSPKPDEAGKTEEKKDEKGGSEEPKPDELRMIGTAVFKDDKVVGNLDIYETQAFLMLTHQFNEAFLTIDDPLSKNHSIVFRLMGVNTPDIRYQSRDGLNYFKVRLKFEADLVSIQSNIGYTNPQKEMLLAKRIATTIKNRVEKVISKAQREYQSDIFGFGVKVRNTMLTTTEWEKYRWKDRFPAAKFKVDVKIAIRRIGVQFQPSQRRE